MARWTYAFSNGDYTNALWVSATPIKGLSIALEGATQLATRYFDDTDQNDSNLDSDGNSPFRVQDNKLDFLANSAAFFEVGYVMHNFLNLK